MIGKERLGQLSMLASLRAQVRPASSSGVGRHLRRRAVPINSCLQAGRAGNHTLGFVLHSRTSTFAPNAEDTTVPATAKNVFEDPTNDYAVVQETLQPLPPPITELIEAKLPRLLSKPDTNDSHVFEDIQAEDYAQVLASGVDGLAPSSVSDYLHRLVTTSRLDEAYQVLKEIRTSGMHVQPSFIYLYPACAATLPSSSLSTKEQTQICLDWLSLLPYRTPTEKAHFGLLRKSLFGSPSSNVFTAFAASIAVTEKGYGEAISAHAVPFIVRHAPPEIGLNILVQLEDANLRYWTSRDSPTDWTAVDSFVTKIRSAAAKTFAHSGSLDIAIKLLPDATNPTFKLTSLTYDAILKVLERERPDEAELHKHVTLLRSQDATCFPSSVRGEQSQENIHTRQLYSMANRYHPSYIGRDAAPRLRKILDVLHQEQVPPLSLITELLHRHAELDREPISRMLFQAALELHPSTASHFLLAEMLFYRQRREYSSVIGLFTNHFYSTVVPPALLRSYTRTERPDTAALSNSSEVVSNSSEVVSTTSYTYRPRLWPSHAHTDLVWQSLVYLAPSLEETEKLYETFLKIVHQQVNEADPLTGMPIAHLSPPPSWSRVADTEAFTAFMTRLGTSVHQCSAIFNDMLKAGLIPPIHAFTQLVGAFARKANGGQAFFIVDTLEKAHPQNEPVHPKAREREEATLEGEEGQAMDPSVVPFKRNPKDKLPKPDLAFYTSTLTNFLKAGCISDAVAIDNRIKARFLYEEGLHPPLDKARLKLEHLIQRKKNRS